MYTWEMPYKIERKTIKEWETSNFVVNGDIYAEIDEFDNLTGNQIAFVDNKFEYLHKFEDVGNKFIFMCHSLIES
tara:strand:+ start:10558 stop:10782 length:225 start_codon:yes stop_codon:yes gene_type:complete